MCLRATCILAEPRTKLLPGAVLMRMLYFFLNIHKGNKLERYMYMKKEKQHQIFMFQCGPPKKNIFSRHETLHVTSLKTIIFLNLSPVIGSITSLIH